MFKSNFLLVIFIVVITSLFAETWIYEREVVIIPVGEKENEIRLNYNEYEERSGPTSFAIDEDENIYIKTSRGNILKKFDKTGKYICSSKFEKGCGDFIRFIGYHNGMIYTMNGHSIKTSPVVRRYDKELNLIDCHKIKKDYERQWIGLYFISNYKGDFGLLINRSPQSISFRKIELQNNHWRMVGTKLMDFSYKKVDLKQYCDAIAFHFTNYDNHHNLYFEALTGYKIKNKIYIISSNGKVIETNILLDNAGYHEIFFSDTTNIFISRAGDVYNIIPLKDGFRFVKWHKIREEK